MKRLYLLRHAQAASSALSDKERPLTDKGVQQAVRLGKKMQETGYTPQICMCSPALRTKQTLEGVQRGGEVQIPFSDPEKLYNASVDDLFGFMHEVDADVESLLLVNHNPSVHQLSFMLCSAGDEKTIQLITGGYDPCTLSVIDFESEWADLKPGDGTLTDVIPPLL